MKRAAVFLFVLAVLACAAAPVTGLHELYTTGGILLAGSIWAAVLHALNS